MRVLVTGGAGFVGSSTMAKLSESTLELAVVDNFSSGDRTNLPTDTTIYDLDIRDLSGVLRAFREFRPTHVLHAAGDLSGRLPDLQNMVGTAEVNVLGGINILKAMMDVGSEKLVSVSTAAVYGEVAEDHWAVEDEPLRPLTLYGASKAAFELLLEPIRKNGLQIAILRYANVYGPRQDAGANGGVVSRFFRQILSGETVKIFGRDQQNDGGCRRDYVSIDDVVDANILALTSDITGTYNVSTKTSYRTSEVLDLISQAVGISPSIQSEPPRPGELKSSGQDCTRLLQCGWGPPLSLNEGIQRYCQQFQQKYAKEADHQNAR